MAVATQGFFITWNAVEAAARDVLRGQRSVFSDVRDFVAAEKQALELARADAHRQSQHLLPCAVVFALGLVCLTISEL